MNIKNKNFQNSKNYKLLIITILTILLLTSLVSAVTKITKTQLESYTNTQIKNYLENNFAFNKTTSNNNTINFYYTTESIRKQGKLYLLFTYKHIAKLSKSDWEFCLNKYSYAICKTNMITNYGTYGVTNKTTIYQQIKKDLTNQYNQIIYWRDYTTPVETQEQNINGSVTI